MGRIKVVEFHNANWNIYPVLDSEMVAGRTMREHLLAQDIEWDVAKGGNIRTADLLFFKGVMDLPPHPRRILDAFYTEVMKRVYGKPFLTLMGEPREHCHISYLFSDKEATMCVAPDDELDRIFVPKDWRDPRVEGWKDRQDRFCWIGRPMPDRVRAAKEMVKNGVDLDIYNKSPWPLSCWKGFAPDDYETALGYKYRIVFENYPTHRYHSEKLFLSVRSGCITFYRGDPRLDMPEIRGLFVPYSIENIVERRYDERAILGAMGDFMRSDAWKMYSYGSFINTVIKKVYQRLEVKGP